MDKILEDLKQENICFKCHYLLDSEPDKYDEHVKNCEGEDSNVITTKFYTNKEMEYKAAEAIKRKRSMYFTTTFQKTDRPATR